MGLVSFARGVPAPECLPVSELADCARAAIEADGTSVLSYGPGVGYPPLREWIAERHGVEPARVVVTNGSLQGFVFLAEQLVRPGHARARRGADLRPAAEDPHAARRRHRRPCRWTTTGSTSTRSSGRSTDGPKPAFLYTIPTFQNPSGRTLSEERRKRIAELAREHDLLVLEDDPYGLVRFEGEALPTALRARGRRANVVYSSSFSKTIAPGVRVGYFVLPPALAAQLEALAVSTYISPPFLTQATVYEFLRRGNFEPNLERVRGLLQGAARRDARRARASSCADGATWSRPEGGYFVWLDLPDETDDRAAAPRRGGRRHVRQGHGLLRRRRRPKSARLAFSFVSPEEIADGIESSPGYCLARRRRRLRSSCESRTPTQRSPARG